MTHKGKEIQLRSSQGSFAMRIPRTQSGMITSNEGEGNLFRFNPDHSLVLNGP